MARRRVAGGIAPMAAALVLSILLAGCGTPRTAAERSTGETASGDQGTRGSSVSGTTVSNQEGAASGEKVTSETPVEEAPAEGANNESRLGSYDSRTNLTIDMVPKAAIYPQGGSADDIARAVVTHMGKKHENLRVNGVQLKGNGWDKSTGVEGVSAWATYLLDTEGGNIGMQVLYQGIETLLVTESNILKVDDVNGYDVQKNEIVPLASVTPPENTDVLVDFDDVYIMREGMTDADLPPHQVVPVQKDDGTIVDVTMYNVGQ